MSIEDLLHNAARGMFENMIDNLKESVEIYYKAFKNGVTALDNKEAFAYAYVFGYLENYLEDFIKNSPDVKNIQREDLANELIKNEPYKSRILEIVDKITDL